MSEVASTDDTRAIRAAQLRKLTLAIAGASALFWLYTFYYIAHVPVGDGTGFQWLAVFPLGAIFLVLTLPALLLVWFDRVVRLALAFAFLGAAAFAVVWIQLLAEFPH